MSEAIGAQFVKALTAKDHDAMHAVLAPDVDFRALTPNKFWEAATSGALIDEVFEVWFGPEDHVEAIESMEHETVVDRERVGYRIRVMRDNTPHLVDQQAYFHVTDGQIDWLRIMCAGYQSVSA